ncbi:MAG: COX15/CtaA family protein, partial [Gaiellaceae bacterium]
MDVGAQSVSRLRAGFSLSDAAIRRLVLANAAMLVLIVATGATVRLTGSGLGCEHWPG